MRKPASDLKSPLLTLLSPGPLGCCHLLQLPCSHLSPSRFYFQWELMSSRESTEWVWVRRTAEACPYRSGAQTRAGRPGCKRRSQQPDGTCRALQVGITGGLTEPAELYRWTSQVAWRNLQSFTGGRHRRPDGTCRALQVDITGDPVMCVAWGPVSTAGTHWISRVFCRQWSPREGSGVGHWCFVN